MGKQKPQILLTNDDGIESPGLWAAAEALAEIGYVWVAAPRDQASSTGRSMPTSSDGRILVKQMTVHGQEWTVHAVGGTPAQTVLHAIYEIMDQPPDLVVSGINYGLNIGLSVTVSGTVGAALEGLANGVPSIAVSLETPISHFYSLSDEIDFSAAANFTSKFAWHLLNQDLGTKLLKLEVPQDATPETEWKVCRMSTEQFYKVSAGGPRDWAQSHHLDWSMREDIERFKPGTDLYVVLVERKVAVTPMTLDMTAPISFDQLSDQFSKR
jgi:5'-nucleotidase